VAPPADVPGLATVDLEKKAALRGCVPHLVILMDDVDQLDLMGRAKRCGSIRRSSGGRQRELHLPDNGGWRMRTYERGVEAETLACGPGRWLRRARWTAGGSPSCPPHPHPQSPYLEVKAKRVKDGRYDEVWLAGRRGWYFGVVLT